MGLSLLTASGSARTETLKVLKRRSCEDQVYEGFSSFNIAGPAGFMELKHEALCISSSDVPQHFPYC